MEQNFIILLRLLHIFFGVFWAGALFYMSMFILPASNAIPEGGKFMQQLARTNRLPVVMMLAATISILSGILLMWKLYDFNSTWMGSDMGMLFSTGGAFAVIAYLIGFMVNMPTVAKISSIGKSVAVSGGTPTPEQIQTMNKLRGKLSSAIRITAILIAASVICMSVARYV